MKRFYTEDALIERPAIALLGTLGRKHEAKLIFIYHPSALRYLPSIDIAQKG